MTTLQELLRRAADDVGGPVVVLLFASSGIEPEIVQMAETLEVFPGRRLKIARPGHLIAVKLLARRRGCRMPTASSAPLANRTSYSLPTARAKYLHAISSSST